MFETTREGRTALAQAEARIRALWAPPPQTTVSQWADAHRILPKSSSNRAGRWITESFQRELMDALCDPDVQEIVCMKSTQVGWTEALLNVVGFFIDGDPRPILFVQPSLEDAKEFSKTRIAPMIQETPSLAAKVRKPRAKSSGNTLLLKEFPGGFLKITGANSGKGLRSRAVSIVLLDEVDGYPDDVDGEGDPVMIATRRTDAYPDRKILKGSTPGKPKGLSRIERDFLRSDRRRFHVPCPHCGAMQVLQWRDEAGTFRLVWDKDAEGRPIRESVRYLCAHCGEGIEERHKQTMLDAGRWVAAYPGRPVVGFHINALYSPWKENWHELAQEWSEAQDNQEALKAFVNLRLGETWEEGGESISPESLAARLEHYEAEVPAGVVVLVCAVDVQGDRLEAKIVGFGPGEESWLIAYEIFHGDPGATEGGGPSVWDELEAFRLREWTHASGAKLRPAITLVDSGDGNHVDSVYDYVQPRQGARHRVYAVKGVEYLAKPGLVSEGTARRAHIRLWLVGTKAAKDRIFSRLRLRKPGPGCMHLPDWTPDNYLEQLTNEKKVVLHNKRTGTRKEAYVRVGRNEALDLEVYALAGLAVMQRMNPSLVRVITRNAESSISRQSLPPPPVQRTPSMRTNSWVHGWK